MVTMSAVVGVAVVALGLVLTPGPNMMYLVSRSISQGRTAGLVSLTGVVTGLCVYVVATAAGLSALFAAVPSLFVVIKIAGAAYLLYLAWGVFRGGRRVFDGGGPAEHSRRRLYAMGLTTCLLNPKIALMYAALLPQFVDPALGSVHAQIIELGLVQIAVATTVNAMWVLLAAGVRRLMETRSRVERVTRWATTALLAGFAVHLGASHPSPSKA